MTSFKSRLNYSFGNEDWLPEHQALQIRPGDRVLCVTASGDRPLHVLLDDCLEVVAVDINPLQTYLLELKMAAMEKLPYDQYMGFLGAKPANDRFEKFNHFKHVLRSETEKYWVTNSNLVQAGILYQGVIERLVHKVSLVLGTIRRNKIKRLFSFDDLEEQRKFVEKEWNTYSWRKLITFAVSIARWFLRDPGLHALSAGNHVNDRMQLCLNQHLAKTSSLMSLVFRGFVDVHGYPPYLTEHGYHVIRPKLNRIKPVTEDLITYLENCSPSSFDAFSLSDVASYISKSDFDRLIRAIYHTARPGARFSIRHLHVKHQIPAALQPYFLRDHSLEQQLEQNDRCFVYNYMTGHIRKSE